MGRNGRRFDCLLYTSYPLLILDDFGMERGTEYGLEQVYSVIDSRYRKMCIRDRFTGILVYYFSCQKS